MSIVVRRASGEKSGKGGGQREDVGAAGRRGDGERRRQQYDPPDLRGRRGEEDRGQMRFAVGGWRQKTEIRSQRAEDGRQKADDRGQQAVMKTRD